MRTPMMSRSSSRSGWVRVPAARPRIVAGPPLSPDRKAALEAATRLYAATRNRLDPEPLVERLAEAVVYESQRVLEPIVGRDAVAAYLRERYDVLRRMAGERDTGRVEMGEIGLPRAADHPCGIFVIEHRRESLAVLSLDTCGLVARIDLLSVTPRPEEAVESGEVPW
jgi:hypothetical protein